MYFWYVSSVGQSVRLLRLRRGSLPQPEGHWFKSSTNRFCEDVRVVKETALRSVGEIRVGSIPTPRSIHVS